MSAPLFLADLPAELPAVGAGWRLDGPEGRHAAVVRRIGPGETIVVADGAGRGLRCTVTGADKTGLDLEVLKRVTAPERPRRVVVAQALAKGDRAELAVEMLTELGVDEIIPWPSARSVVRWQGERGQKSLARWRSAAREAAKQSRRLRVPAVSDPHSSRQLTTRAAAADLTLVLHEDAVEPLTAVDVPAAGEILLVVGPEGGITADELAALQQAGGRLVVSSDGVLRTSTAGAAAVAQLAALAAR